MAGKKTRFTSDAPRRRRHVMHFSFVLPPMQRVITALDKTKKQQSNNNQKKNVQLQ
jgi:hypothetical protein